MATQQSTQTPLNASPNSAELEAEKVFVADAYLRPETVTTEALSIAGFALAPIHHGVQHCAGTDHSVKAIQISRSDIDKMLAAIEREQPDLHVPLEIVRTYMCALDSVRGEAKLDVLTARRLAAQAESNVGDRCRDELDTVVKQLGTWNDEYRLILS